MSRIAVPLLSLLLAPSPANATPFSTVPPERRATPLDVEVGSVHLRLVSITEALRAVRANAPPRSVFFTVEVVPFREWPENNLTLSFQRATVGQILANIAAQDPRYTYEVVDSHLIHVFPRHAKQDPADLLNVRVRNLVISEQQYDILVKYPQYFIPELEHQIELRSGTSGYAGSMMGGVSVPKVSLNVKDGTVRDVLNRLAQKTEEFEKLAPAGWMYSFKIDESSALGGHPAWQTF